MRGSTIRSIVVAICIGLPLLALPSVSTATIIDIIKKDLAPLAGYIVMPAQKQYLVDLDVRNDLKVGDLLSVVKQGKKIVHPVSKVTLGYLEEVKAILKVTQIKEGYSYAQLIGKNASISQGDKVKRFFNLSAAYIGNNNQFYDRLRFALPELLWQGQFPTGSDLPKVDMTFTTVGKQVDLLDSLGNKLRSYSLAGERIATKPSPQVTTAKVPAPAPAPVPTPTPEPVILEKSPDIEFGSYTNLGELPGRVRMSAFFRDEKDLLMATIDNENVHVLNISNNLMPIFSTQISGGIANPLTVHWWRPTPSGPLYLVVSAAYEEERNSGVEVTTKLAGSIFEWRDGKLKLVSKNLRWFMGSYDRDGDGIPETLLAQEFDFDLIYSRVFALQIREKRIKKSAVPFELPRRFVVPGSIMADLTGDGKVEIVTVYNGTLAIYSGRERIYQSSQGMGGSIATLTYDTNPGDVDLMHNTITFDVPPAVADLDKNGILEIFAPSSDGSMFKMPGISPGITKSWVAVIKSRDGVFKKGKLPGDIENPIQGIWVDNNRLFVVESRTDSTFFGGGKSYLLQFEFSQ